jgi:malate dehydrogenase (oxaloacetate-decarboxylating)
MLRGKIEVQSRIPIDSLKEEEQESNESKKQRKREGEKQEAESILDLIYTPGVAHIAKEISKNDELAYKYTSKWNNVAIICDGSRILGLGNIGPKAAIPVMEGKAVLFKALSGINAFPLCLATQEKEEIINFVKAVEPVFGAINIEDIASPKVLEIVERLQHELPIPVFHDDQHGTAVITLAALLNATKLIGQKRLDDVKIVIAGAGSSGYGIFKILHKAGCKNIIVLDSRGALYKGRNDGIDNPFKKEIADKTNVDKKLTGNLEAIIKDADVFIGVSSKEGLLTPDMVRSMSNEPIVFALSNPKPEILPNEALEAGARIVSTGRSDYANQVNNALVFPYMIRGLLDNRIRNITEDTLIAVSYAIAEIIKEDSLKEDNIIPKLNDPRLYFAITQVIKKIQSSKSE